MANSWEGKLVERESSDLSAYLDKELSPEKEREVRMMISSDPEAAREFEQLKRNKTMFAYCVEKPNFHSSLISRVTLDESRRKFRRATLKTALIAAITLIVVSASALTAHFADRFASSPWKISTAGNFAKPSQPTSKNDDNNFEAVAGAAVSSIPGNVEAQLPQFELLGAITGKTPMAIIDVKDGAGKGAQVFQVGDEIAEGVKLLEIRQEDVVLESNGQQIILAKQNEDSAATSFDLSGEWGVRITGDNINSTNIYLTTIKQTGVEFEATLDSKIIARGRLVGKSFQVCILEPPYNAIDSFSGYVRDDWNSAVIPLKAFRSEIATMWRSDVEEVPENIAITLERRLQDQTKQSPQFSDMFRSKEIQELFKPLDAFARARSDKAFPKTLEELVPDYAPDLSTYADNDERTIQYIPGLRLLSEVRDIDLDSAKLDDSLPYPNALIKLEQASKENGKEPYVFKSPLLRVHYKTPEAVYEMDAYGYVQRRYIPSDMNDPAKRDVIVNEIQTSLKQIGLIVKMFATEHYEHTPPGWLTVYPEYLSNPSILTCPLDPIGTKSYLYLCPAVNIEERFHNPSGDGMEIAMSDIPMAMNSSDLPVIHGKYVLFADGHVEFADSAKARELERFWSRY
jgi:prepilin-type processing-associated H-X9-DG protein